MDAGRRCMLARRGTPCSITTITCGAPFDGGNVSYVAEVVTLEGTAAVLKVALAAAGVAGFSPFEQELETCPRERRRHGARR